MNIRSEGVRQCRLERDGKYLAKPTQDDVLKGGEWVNVVKVAVTVCYSSASAEESVVS